MSATSALTQFNWHPQPDAAQFIQELVNDFQEHCPWLASLTARMRAETGTRLVDWIDHFRLRSSPDMKQRLAGLGYTDRGENEWRIDSGLFPPIKLEGKFLGWLLKVESVREFLLIHGTSSSGHFYGEPGDSIRWAYAPQGAVGEHIVSVIERHGDPSLSLKGTAVDPGKLLLHEERLLLRRRSFDVEAMGFEHARQLIEKAAADLGMPRACDLFFRAERAYWQSRNRAAQIQKMRQDALGLGWANHDHHTYRSSREHFATLIGIFETMGFHCRERFYAGKEAGWGAQVLEEPNTGVVIFADVDLSPEEVAQDFSHEPLAPRDTLGTVGLWCKLHGEAFLEAGMHHLECQFDFDAARDELKEVGVNSMKPFTDFPYLRQAFTKGEVWPVAEKRVARLLSEGLITPEQAENFRTKGAVGSHLEILERNDGYKGFNQTGINEIIRDTDPRKLAEALPTH
jgi:hypothetical protein